MLNARLCFVLGALLAAVALHAEDELGATPQLLLNGGFERGEGDRAADWGLWPPFASQAGVSSTRDGASKHSGDFSGRLQVTPDDFAGICTFHHNAVPVRPGQELVLKLWIRAEGAEQGCGADVQLRHGAEIVGSAAIADLKGSFDWREIVHRFTIPPGTDQACVVPLLRGKGTVWFDDVRLYAAPATVPVQVTQPPKLDGLLTDACWATDGLTGFTLMDGNGVPARQTTVWTAYDPTCLYFAFRCDKQPGDRLRKTVTRRDGPVWNDDDLEIFLSPSGDYRDYYQFVLNPAGTRYDSHLTDAGWDADWRAAVKDAPEAWTVEVAIPLAGLPLDLSTGSTWCANFGRSDRIGNEASSWSCTFGSFHAPGRFGLLSDMALDLVPFYEKDARGRVTAVRREYDAALAGLDVQGVPAALATPYQEREPAIRTGLQRLESILQRTKQATADEWAAVRPSALALSQQIADLQAATARMRVFAAWKSDKVPQPKYGLATASPMEKIRRDGTSFTGSATKELELSAAGNEYEAAQVVLVSLAGADVADCTAEVSPLTGPGGKLDAPKLELVDYITTAQPGYATEWVGDWPDPIVPLRAFALKAGQVQPLWLRVYVPAGTRAGDYRGTVTVRGAGQEQRLAVKLHVFGFDLPRRQHLATPFGCNPATLSQWYTGSGDYQQKMPPEVWRRWNDFLLNYRITPTHVASAYVKETRGADGKTQLDFSLADQNVEAVVDRLPLQGVAMAGIGSVGWSANNSAKCVPTDSDAHGGKRSGKVYWPKAESWASIQRGMPGQTLADKQCRAFRFWVKALQPGQEKDTITAFVNDFPNRWVTTFPLGGTEWHEVRIPVAQYHHNTTGEPLTPADLKTCGNFQFVISGKSAPIEYLMDDVVAECEGGDVVIDDFEVETETAAVREQLEARLQHWRDKGWYQYGHVYARDEIRPEEYDQLVPIYQRCKELVPDIPLMQTYYANRTPEQLIGPIKIWCAITSVYDRDFLEPRRKAGEPIWLYVCCGPGRPYANFFIDQPGIDHRLLFWQTWQQNATGLLYWEMNYWHGMTPLTAEEPRWPDVPWDQTKVATYREFKVNGDGFLIYPGPDWTPYPSVRLENIRDGIEDYEYLWLLRDRDPQNKLLTVGPELSEDFTHYCKDPRVLEQRRLDVARAIERAGR